MRLKRNRTQCCYHRKAVFQKDKEGSSSLVYAPATEISSEVWPAGGKAQAETYGTRLNYIQNMRIDGSYKVESDGKKLHYVLANGADLVENDGICIYVSGECEPDYKIVSIKPYRHLLLEVEKICQ